MRFYEFRQINKSIITEGARIDHAEDIIFDEGSKGAIRAIESLKKLEQGGHENVTIKWDGSPAIVLAAMKMESLYLQTNLVLLKKAELKELQAEKTLQDIYSTEAAEPTKINQTV